MTHYFKIIILIYLTVNTLGCTLPPYLKLNTRPLHPEQVSGQNSKWVFVGKISSEYPNVMRVLMIHTEDMGKALAVMRKNSQKYSAVRSEIGYEASEPAEACWESQ